MNVYGYKRNLNSLEYSLTPHWSSVGWGVGESDRKLRTRSFESTDWGASGVDPVWGWRPKRSLRSTAASLCSRLKTLGSDVPLNQQQKTTPKGKKQKLGLASLLYFLRSAGLLAYRMELLSKQVSPTRFSGYLSVSGNPLMDTPRCVCPSSPDESLLGLAGDPPWPPQHSLTSSLTTA